MRGIPYFCPSGRAIYSLAFWIQWEHVSIYATKLRLTNPIQDDGISLKETGLRRNWSVKIGNGQLPPSIDPHTPKGYPSAARLLPILVDNTARAMDS